MGRPSDVTYDRVAAACEALVAAGIPCTLKAVVEKLAGPSSSTIHPHWRTWKENQPKPAAAVVTVPSAIASALNAWVAGEAAAAKTDLESRLETEVSAASDLSLAGRALEARCEYLQDQAATLATERDQAEATAKARAAEIERLTSDIERERRLAGDAQIEAAGAKLKVDNQSEQISELKSAKAALSTALDAERQGRISAEKDAAVLASELKAARSDVGAERTRVAGLQAHLDKAHADAKSLRAELEQRMQIAEEAHEKALSKTRAELEIERTAAQSALQENARLKARIESNEEIHSTLTALNKQLMADLAIK